MPYGIKQLYNGNIAIVDTENCRIKIINENGDLITKFGMFGSNYNEFNRPTAITQLFNGHIAICDTNNNCIKIFIHKFINF